MKEIIEILYPEELGVITAKPAVAKPKRVKILQFKDQMWAKQSRAVKTAVSSLLFLLVTGSVYYYNLFITELFDVHLEMAQVNAEIQRKNTFIPDMAKVVEDFMTYEGRVFVHAVDLRSALAPFMEQTEVGAAHQKDMQTLSRFKSAISKFQSIAENYPVLKASEAYQKFMLELANTERRLINARNRYNFVVNRYNTGLV